MIDPYCPRYIDTRSHSPIYLNGSIAVTLQNLPINISVQDAELAILNGEVVHGYLLPIVDPDCLGLRSNRPNLASLRPMS